MITQRMFNGELYMSESQLDKQTLDYFLVLRVKNKEQWVGVSAG